MSNSTFPYLGFGLGLRPEHYDDILQTNPAIDWFEIITENYLVPGGKPLNYLDKICERYPVVMHGVSLSIGSTDPLDKDYLQKVRQLADRVKPKWISDHLCWNGINQLNMHDLLPLPYTKETIKHISNRIKQVQDILQRQILIENVSSYLSYKNAEMTEWEFISQIAEAADCYILLDINNIYVSAFNHHFDPIVYIKGIPKKRVIQHHLAGHHHHGDYIIDTHDAPIIDSVWDLYSQAVQHFGPVSTMIERDDNIPPLEILLKELVFARQLTEKTLKQQELIICG